MSALSIQGISALLPSEDGEGERSEPEPTTRGNKAERAVPDPEVVQHASRRQFSASYKHRILTEVDAAVEKGAVGRILRREGLYSSHLTHWRQERDEAQRAALEPKKRGPKPAPNNPLQAECDKLKRENIRLSRKLRKAELIIDFQKKVSEILGIALPVMEHNDDEVNS